MTKLKSLKLKYQALLVFALAVGVVGLGLGVKAYQGFAPKTVIENVENYNEAPELQNAVGAEEELLGAVTGPEFPNPNCTNDLCTWVVSGSFADATNTFVSVQDPFEQTTSTGIGGIVFRLQGGVGITGASSTVDYVALHQTGAATSSYGVACGPSITSNGGGIVVAKEIVTTTAVAGTTLIPTSSVGILQNNMTGAQGNRVNGGTVAKILLGPTDPYFVCLADLNPDGLAGISNADNTFAGKYYIRFTRPRI